MLATVWHQMNTPVLYALPVFTLSIAVEAFALRDHDQEQTTGYSGKDTRTS